MTFEARTKILNSDNSKTDDFTYSSFYLHIYTCWCIFIDVIFQGLSNECFWFTEDEDQIKNRRWFSNTDMNMPHIFYKIGWVRLFIKKPNLPHEKQIRQESLMYVDARSPGLISFTYYLWIVNSLHHKLRLDNVNEQVFDKWFCFNTRFCNISVFEWKLRYKQWTLIKY